MTVFFIIKVNTIFRKWIYISFIAIRFCDKVINRCVRIKRYIDIININTKTEGRCRYCRRLIRRDSFGNIPNYLLVKVYLSVSRYFINISFYIFNCISCLFSDNSFLSIVDIGVKIEFVLYKLLSIVSS